jgi:hypothetical protein
MGCFQNTYQWPLPNPSPGVGGAHIQNITQICKRI